MYFDVKSLFTSIPLQLALDCTENAVKNFTVELPLLQTTLWTYSTSVIKDVNIVHRGVR